MGVVYKAEDIKLKRTVALKFLAAHLLNDEETKARFQREADAALTHSNMEKKIVHRDIKPANLMISGSSSKLHVTIMDFRLTQLAGHPARGPRAYRRGWPVAEAPKERNR